MNDDDWKRMIDESAAEIDSDPFGRDELVRRFHNTDDHGVARAQFLGGATDRVVRQLIRRAMIGLVN